MEVTPKEVIEWFNAQGVKNTVVATRIGVSPATITNIKQGKHVGKKALNAFKVLIEEYNENSTDICTGYTPPIQDKLPTKPLRKKRKSVYATPATINSFTTNLLIYGVIAVFCIITTINREREQAKPTP